MTRRGALMIAGSCAMRAQSILELAPPKADARLTYGADPNQFGDLRMPEGKGPHPVVVFIHGGFWRSAYDLGHAGHLCAALTKAGAATWNIEYRRVGNAGGGWPGTFQDIGVATDFLRTMAVKYQLDLTRVIVVGHSSGGHLALWLAARGKIPPKNPLYVRDPLTLKGAIDIDGPV